MADQPPGYEPEHREHPCYNCGLRGHITMACPEPTRPFPAGLEASLQREKSSGSPGFEGSNHNRRSKGPVITRYPVPPPQGSAGPRYEGSSGQHPMPGVPPGYPPPPPTSSYLHGYGHSYGPPPPPLPGRYAPPGPPPPPTPPSGAHPQYQLPPYYHAAYDYQYVPPGHPPAPPGNTGPPPGPPHSNPYDNHQNPRFGSTPPGRQVHYPPGPPNLSSGPPGNYQPGPPNLYPPTPFHGSPPPAYGNQGPPPGPPRPSGPPVTQVPAYPPAEYGPPPPSLPQQPPPYRGQYTRRGSLHDDDYGNNRSNYGRARDNSRHSVRGYDEIRGPPDPWYDHEYGRGEPRYEPPPNDRIYRHEYRRNDWDREPHYRDDYAPRQWSRDRSSDRRSHKYRDRNHGRANFDRARPERNRRRNGSGLPSSRSKPRGRSPTRQVLAGRDPPPKTSRVPQVPEPGEVKSQVSSEYDPADNEPDDKDEDVPYTGFRYDADTIFLDTQASIKEDAIGEPLPSDYFDGVMLPPAYNATAVKSKYITPNNVDDFAQSVQETREWQVMQYHPAFLSPTTIAVDRLYDYFTALNPNGNRTYRRDKHNQSQDWKRRPGKYREFRPKPDIRKRGRDSQGDYYPSQTESRLSPVHCDEPRAKRPKTASPEPGEVLETTVREPDSRTPQTPIGSVPVLTWTPRPSETPRGAEHRSSGFVDGSVRPNAVFHEQGFTGSEVHTFHQGSKGAAEKYPTAVGHGRRLPISHDPEGENSELPSHPPLATPATPLRESRPSSRRGSRSRRGNDSSKRPDSRRSSFDGHTSSSVGSLSPIGAELLGMGRPSSSGSDTSRDSRKYQRDDATPKRRRQPKVVAAYQRRW